MARDAATAVYGRAKLDGWTFDAETLALARALGFRLREVGVEWSDREGSRLSMARVLVPVVRELAAARRHVRREVARRGARTRPRPRAPPDVRALGVALGALAFAPLAGLLLRVASKGGHFAGGDGFLVLDQMQYLNWLRQAGSHLLIGNLYDLAPGPRTFLHPGLLISGALNALGLGPTAAYLVWKPVAVLALWAGATPWCERFLPRGGGAWRRVALALFFSSPLAALVGWSGWGGFDARFDFDFLSGELTTNNFVWGYLFTAIAVGLLPLGLLAHERGRTGLAAAAGLIVAWLQPWQGATFLLVLGGAEVLAAAARGWRRVAVVAPPPRRRSSTTSLLSRLDDSWRLAGEANDFGYGRGG